MLHNVITFLIVVFSQNLITPKKISDATISIIDLTIVYDGKYTQISYPGGDVNSGIGVCSDVVIRSLRKLGLDLQKEIHEDMAENFGFTLMEDSNL